MSYGVLLAFIHVDIQRTLLLKITENVVVTWTREDEDLWTRCVTH